MTAKTIGITFEGYWRDEHEESLPSLSGLYCVYKCLDHASTQEVLLEDLIYIGHSADVRDAVARHELRSKWTESLRGAEELCYSYGHLAGEDLERCQAAMVFRHRPSCNFQYLDSFPFPDTTLSLDGRIALLHHHFTVVRTVLPTPSTS